MGDQDVLEPVPDDEHDASEFAEPLATTPARATATATARGSTGPGCRAATGLG
jgi:hypothetical protein